MPIQNNFLTSMLISLVVLTVLVIVSVAIYYLMRCPDTIRNRSNPSSEEQELGSRTQEYNEAWNSYLRERGRSVDTLPRYTPTSAAPPQYEADLSRGNAHTSRRKSGGDVEDTDGFVDVPLDS